jgi:hypothetical protein
MSIYSLDTQTPYKYYIKHRENLLNLSDREYVNSHFLLGEKVNKKEQIFSTVMLELLCTNNCELSKFLDDKLQGRQEGKRTSTLEEVDIDNGGNVTYNVTQIINNKMNWQETAW